MLVVVDLCYSSHKYCYPNLIKTLDSFDVEYKVITKIKDLPDKVTGLIISGSPLRITKPINIKKINVAIYCLLNYKVPTLGICFGFQLLNSLHGGTIKAFGRLVCEKHEDLQFCFNDVIDKLGVGFEIKRKIKIDNKQVICHIEKEHMTGYLFHAEADQDKSGYIKQFMDKLSDFKDRHINS